MLVRRSCGGGGEKGGTWCGRKKNPTPQTTSIKGKCRPPKKSHILYLWVHYRQPTCIWSVIPSTIHKTGVMNCVWPWHKRVVYCHRKAQTWLTITDGLTDQTKLTSNCLGTAKMSLTLLFTALTSVAHLWVLEQSLEMGLHSYCCLRYQAAWWFLRPWLWKGKRERKKVCIYLSY